MRIESLRVLIWPADHRPAHVHVRGPDGEAVFKLNCPDGPPMLRESFGSKAASLGRIERALAAAITALRETWGTIHGDI